jgi:uncharacterized protein (DUF1800 family)
MVRQIAQRNQWFPSDPVEHAIYADQVEFYKAQQAKQAAAAKEAAAASGSDPMMGNAPSMGKKPSAPGGDMAGADMTGGGQPAMADGMAGAAAPPAALAKSDLADGTAPPAKHVEDLFKDLEAVNIINLPPDERMKKVISMAPKDFVSFRQSLTGEELAQFGQGLNPQQREIFAAMQNATRMVGSEELQTRVLRDVYSDRQLEAVMTDFWLNHFNVYLRKNQNEPYLIPAYERETIRPNALGKFEDLLVATAKSPAMLVYLDNGQSVGPDSRAAKVGPAIAARAQNPQVRAALKDRGLNENYARELMELHTVGVQCEVSKDHPVAALNAACGQGYTQADVTNVAKIFTGWSVTPPQQGSVFQFDERRHEPGPKTVLGETIAENGENEGLQLLHMLAMSPATARFISTKLAVRFVSDDPPATIVDKMTRAYLASDGDIKAVLRAMFQAPEFWSPTVERAKVKTPEEFVISAVRASGATVNNAQGLVQALDRLGMPLYGMQTPNGYSWMSEGWVSTGALVNRMNFALVMTGDKLPGTRTDWAKVLGSVVADGAGMKAKPVGMGNTAVSDVDPEVAAKEAKLELVLLGEPVSTRTRATVIAQSNDSTAAIQAAREFQGGGVGGGGQFAAPLQPFSLPIPGARAGGGGPGARVAIPDDRQAAIMAGLLLGSPEFQRR